MSFSFNFLKQGPLGSSFPRVKSEAELEEERREDLQRAQGGKYSGIIRGIYGIFSRKTNLTRRPLCG